MLSKKKNNLNKYLKIEIKKYVQNIFIVMNSKSVANLNVDYLRNGVYENNLKDGDQQTPSKNVFKFNKIFTISNAIKEIQSSENYKLAVKHPRKQNLHTDNDHLC